MQTQCMQERTQAFHQNEHGERQTGPEVEAKEGDETAKERVIRCTAQSNAHHHVPQHLAQLGVRQRERPQTQVGGRVRDRAENVLDRVYRLVNDDLGHIKIFVRLLSGRNVDDLLYVDCVLILCVLGGLLLLLQLLLAAVLQPLEVILLLL